MSKFRHAILMTLLDAITGRIQAALPDRYEETIDLIEEDLRGIDSAFTFGGSKMSEKYLLVIDGRRDENLDLDEVRRILIDDCDYSYAKVKAMLDKVVPRNNTRSRSNGSRAET